VPARVVRGEINASESLSRVSPEADLTFRALIVAVDDFGRFDARPAILKATLFPLRSAFTPEKIMRWVRELAEEGCIDLYEVDARPFLALTGWEKHRGEARRTAKSRYPAPPGLEDPALSGGVYLIRSGDAGPVKIGFTQDFATRLSVLRTTVPNLKILGVLVDEGRAAEKRLHRQFAHLRVDREWFKLGDDLRAWIAQNVQPWPAVGNDGQCPSGPGNADPSGSRESGVGSRESGVESSAAVAAAAPTPRRAKRTGAPEALGEEDLDRLRAWCEVKHRALLPRLPDLVEACLTFHRGKGNVAADWYATCQTWIRNEAEQRFGPSRGSPASSGRPEPGGRAYRPFVPERREGVAVVSILGELRQAVKQ